MTRQRRLVYDIIVKSESHLTAEEIYKRAKESSPSIACGTVYRNLALMAQCGEIRKVIFPGQPIRYEKGLRPHDHMTCVKCKRVFDVCIGDLKPLLTEKSGADIISYELSVLCLCPECKKQGG